jgi:hypothetical protein
MDSKHTATDKLYPTTKANAITGQCAHVPGHNITLFVIFDPIRHWVAGARKNMSAEWLLDDDSPQSFEEAKKIITEWALKNIRMDPKFNFEQGFRWYDIAKGWATAFPKTKDGK